MDLRESESLLCSFGHMAKYSELIAAWGQESAILPLRQSVGLTHHLRHDVYVCAHLGEAELLAARCGGQLDCLTALAKLGVDVAGTTASGDARLHLRMPRHHGHAAARLHQESRPTRVHWSRPRFPMPTSEQLRRTRRGRGTADRLTMRIAEALRQALMSCLPPGSEPDIFAALLDLGMSAPELAESVAATSVRVQRALAQARLPRPVVDALDSLRQGSHFGSAAKGLPDRSNWEGWSSGP